MSKRRGQRPAEAGEIGGSGSGPTDDGLSGVKGLGVQDSIIQCGICHTTLSIIDEVRYEWATGEQHDCDGQTFAWLNHVAKRALNGDDMAAQTLGTFVDLWLRAQR